MVTITEAEELAMTFLMDDLEISVEDQSFFLVISARETGSSWTVVEIGVAGLPDKWVLQVFDTGQCDPCYTFVSPMPKGEDADLSEFPSRIAEVVAAERINN
ncbi:hypothetical protein S7335_4707 [Synechococcus sp. PCC 7335]|uniref:hypothetical protein n=1 Tax=Synechococcus sp. (strain ATCC 29403 / PCC 7335) TaxID=91464 RepID=UPI00017ECB37|nr:hypothetical protein [Synechococcus sp. PCC 7335]EDX87000.1 hypothetical protein S7335_4707 [Synechococcus sp. PCC 7335]